MADEFYRVQVVEVGQITLTLPVNTSALPELTVVVPNPIEVNVRVGE